MGRGFEQRVLRLFGNKVLHVAPRHVLPVRQLILCNPHHACGTEKETETDIISRMVPKSEEIEWKLLQWIKASGISSWEHVFLPPSSFLVYSKEDYPTVLCVPHFSCAGRLGDGSLCVYVTFPHQLRWMCVCLCVFHLEHLEIATACGECLPKTQDTPYNFMYFPHHYFSVEYLCAFFYTCAGLFKV